MMEEIPDRLRVAIEAFVFLSGGRSESKARMFFLFEYLHLQMGEEALAKAARTNAFRAILVEEPGPYIEERSQIN